MPPYALSLRCAAARLLIAIAKICVQAGAGLRRDRVASVLATLGLQHTAAWLASAALRMLGGPRLLRLSASSVVSSNGLTAQWMNRQTGHDDGDPLKRDPTQGQPPLDLPTKMLPHRWLAGSLLLWGSDVALGASQTGVERPLAVLVLGAFGAAAALTIGVAALTTRRRPMLTTPALGLLGLSFVTLALVARGPTIALVLGAANTSIAWRVFWMAIRHDRRGGP